MATTELVESVRKQLTAGVSKENLQAELIKQGWSEQDILETFNILASRPDTMRATASTPPVPPPPATSSASAALNTVSANPPVSNPAQTPPTVSVVPPTISHHYRSVIPLAVAVLLVCASGAVAFAFVKHMGPFAKTIIYTQDNLFTGLLSKVSTISSSSYTASGSFAVVDREPDAKPFTIQNSNQAQLILQYKNDAQRARDIESLLYTLTYKKSTSYPVSIIALNQASVSANTLNRVSIIDPSTKAKYAYEVVDGGKDFKLTVTFETSNAISAVKRSYGFDPASTIISGRTVTFTKNSTEYFYLSSTPPKPFFEQLGELMQQIPPGASASMSVTAASDWSKKNADWKFNLDATADLSDLSFKIDADAIKKGSVYYVRFNNLPGLFGASLTSLKGQWLAIDPAASSTWPKEYSSYLSLSRSLPQSENDYKQSRVQMTELLKQLVVEADQVHLLSFIGAPHQEKVDGRTLYRYDLQINQDAIIPFYQKMNQLAQSYPTLIDANQFNDPGTLDYLQSPEFHQMFYYYQKNTHLVLWVDTDGYPAKLAYTIRVVPPDTAIGLKDKQVTVTFALLLSDINRGVHIDAPSGAKPIGDLMKEEVQARDKARLQMGSGTGSVQ